MRVLPVPKCADQKPHGTISAEYEVKLFVCLPLFSISGKNKGAEKSRKSLNCNGFKDFLLCGAAIQIRTGDLILTN